MSEYPFQDSWLTEALVAIALIAIPLLLFYVLWMALSKTRPNKNHLKNPWLWVGTLVGTPVIYLLALVTWFAIDTYYPKREFNQHQWMTNVEKRYEYADDLVDNQKLIGLTKVEVIRMLGQPNIQDDNSITYYLGQSPRHFIGIDMDWLEIRFENGRVIWAKIFVG